MGFPGAVAGAVALAAVAAGALRVAREHPLVPLWLLATLAAQVAPLMILRPQPFAPEGLARYCAHLLPFLLGLAAAAVPLARPGSRPWREAVAMLLVAGLLTAHLGERRYAVRADQASNVRPAILFVPPRLPPGVAAEVPPFYEELARMPEGALVEAPFLPTFPLYDVYQRVHGREVYTAGSAGGRA